MKDILRRHQILREEIVNILNKQVQIEAQSAANYLAMAAWCDVRGYDNSAEFYFKQSDEERKHQLKLFHYLADMECDAISPAIEEPQHEFTTLRSVFERALEMEIAVTDAIHNVVRECRKHGDIATEEFMRWYVQEQIEEEYVARRCLELFDVLGEDKIALGMFEERVLGIEYEGD
ncbi:ferritin [Fulvivirgaceae bacterium BMA10]|uniref:Ferritin n=1 Tax=Splendidivirga corallicola TaxID=3051826 RepID=A0ABT8KNK4_9BACT|nr:ferritin [Fulvivirgaceae bacterium BMA10]